MSRRSADAARKELEAERRAGAELRRIRESLLEAAAVDKKVIARCGTRDKATTSRPVGSCHPQPSYRALSGIRYYKICTSSVISLKTSILWLLGG